MEKPDRSSFTPLDFATWKESKGLALTPKFQRRGVWKPAARSFLIDTLLRGMPVPPVYIRQIQAPEKNRIVREVIDGQQRISAVLAFMEGEFKLSRTLHADWAGRSFDELTSDQQNAIRDYPFSTETFRGISDLQVLEIFSRLNTYSVALNKQELRNGRFFGLFKQLCYFLAYEHLEFWRKNNLFSERSIARMLEVEFVSEILIAFHAGMQDKKKSIDDFYQDLDEEVPDQSGLTKRFRDVVDEVSRSVGEAIADSNFRRTPLLYSLFCAICHRRFGLPGIELPTPRKPLVQEDQVRLLDAVLVLSDVLERAKDEEESVPSHLGSFVRACQRQTDNIRPRTIRLETIYKTAFR